MLKKLVFFVQTKKPIGGSQVLFLDLASYISEHFSDQYEVYYINHPNPTIKELYGSYNIKFVNVDRCDYNQFEDAVFFTPLNYVFYLQAKIRNLNNAKILLYFYHPQIMDWLSMQIGKKNVDFEPFLQLLKRTNAYCFMDSSNYVALKSISSVDFEERYLPVSIHDKLKDVRVSLPPEATDCLRIGWLGRLDRDKIYSLINLANNLLALESPKRIDLHIIGDGNSKNFIRISNYTPYIRFIFTSYLYGEERNKYIEDNIDIMVAMGMSATDAAQLGVPTVIPIVSPVPFRDDKYIYLYDVKGYSLGWNKDEINQSTCILHTIEEVINDTYVDHQKMAIGEKCRDFANEEFSIENCANRLLSIIELTTLTPKECMSCRLIKREMRLFDLYKKFRKKAGFMRFHEFNARIKRIHQQPTLIKKIKRVRLEIKATLRRKRK